MHILKKVSFIYNILKNLLHYSFESYQYHSLGTISMIILFLILLYIPFYVYGNELYSINKTTLQKDQFGYLHLFGEIKNNSEKILTNITLSSNFIDFDNNIIGTYARSPEINTLNPNQFSPFEIIYLDPNTITKVKNFSLSVDYQIGKAKPNLLSIDHINNRLDFTGFYYINGEIKNIGTHSANNVTVIATIYDLHGNIIGITKAITEPFVIGAKNKAAFGLAVNDKTVASKIKDFAIQAYSDIYLSNTLITKK
jgi:hypothetical protein